MPNEYDDLLQRLVDEYNVPESEIEPLRASSLRKQLAESETERQSLATKVAGFEKAPKKTDAFAKLNIDLENLSAAQRHLYDTYDWEGDEPAEDAVKDFATKFEFPTKAEAPSDEGARGIVAQAGLSTGAHPNTDTVDQQIAAAEKEGNWALASALKSQQVQAIPR